MKVFVCCLCPPFFIIMSFSHQINWTFCSHLQHWTRLHNAISTCWVFYHSRCNHPSGTLLYYANVGIWILLFVIMHSFRRFLYYNSALVKNARWELIWASKWIYKSKSQKWLCPHELNNLDSKIFNIQINAQLADCELVHFFMLCCCFYFVSFALNTFIALTPDWLCVQGTP